MNDTSSFSLKYRTSNIYVALALDSKVEGYDSYRASLQIPFNKAQLGLMFQTSKELNTGNKEEAMLWVYLERLLTKEQ